MARVEQFDWPQVEHFEWPSGHLNELIEEQLAQADYQIKSQVKKYRDRLAELLLSRRN